MADVRFDMYDRELYARPYETYRRLREEAPLYYNDDYEFYCVSRADDVARVLTDRDTFISGKGGVYQFATLGIEMPPGLFIFEDPPLHTIHRKLVSRLFTPRAVSRIEPEISRVFHAAAASLGERTTFDFVQDYATMLPIQVIGMLLGLPEKDYVSLRESFHRSQNEDTANRDEGEAMSGVAEAGMWFTDYLEFRAANPTDDLMTELLHVEFEDETGQTRLLRRDELILFLTLITGAGSDTTVNSIAWAGYLLGHHPDQRRLLQDAPELIDNAVEEVLRYEPPSYHIARTSSVDTEFHGHRVPAGSVMITLPGAANRDDRHFAEPEMFDITRSPGQTFTFSMGPHFCLGAALAKVETRIAIEAFLRRFPDWSVDDQNAEMTSGIDTRGWDALPVHVSH